MGRLGKSVIRGKTWEPFGTPEDSGELCVWKIRKIGKFRSWEIARIGNSGASGNLVATGLRGIGENRYMWLKCETLSGRTHGLPTNWEIEVLGDSADWKLGESGRFGRLGNSGVWEIRGFRKNHYMWQKLRSSWKPEDTGANWGERKIRELREIGKNYYTRQKLRTSRNRELGDFGDSENIGTFGILGDLGECGI